MEFIHHFIAPLANNQSCYGIYSLSYDFDVCEGYKSINVRLGQ